jgi:ABC-2 type transport system permease protein
LIIPAGILSSGRVTYYARNLSDPVATYHLARALNRTVVNARMREAHIDLARLQDLSREVTLDTFKLTERGPERHVGDVTFYLALSFGAFIMLTILFYGQVILSSLIEEKANRLSEILLSSTGALSLVTGKLIGVMLLLLTQVFIWFVAIFLIISSGFVRIPLEALRPTQLSPGAVGYCLLFFVLGFALYAALFVLVGSTVSSEKEASHLTVYLSLIPIVGIYLVIPVIRDPDSSFAFWASRVPLFSPTAMCARLLTEAPPFWQVAFSISISVITVSALLWVSARVYRKGMVVYGKRVAFAEIFRWIRQSS